MNQPTLARRAAKGAFWNYLSFGVGKLLVLGTTAILARLLVPEAFGLVALATVAVSYLAVLKDLGLGQALIQRQADVDQAADTVFTLNLALGALLTGAAWLSAPWVAAYFREPQVTPILRWLGLTFALNALGAVHTVRLQRELDFRRKIVPDLGRALVKGVVAISAAWSGYGVWSLVVGQLAGVVSGVVLAWLVLPWRPRLHIDRQLARGLLKFGVPVLGVDALAVLNDSLDYLIIGRLLGSVALGIYTLAYRIPELLIFNILWVMGGIIFPTYAKMQDEPAALRRAFLMTTRFMVLITVPLCLGLMLAADPLVRIFWGEQWLAAIPVVRMLAVYALVRSVGYHVGGVYKAVGRPDILVKLGLLNVVVLAPALWIGAQYGLVAIAAAHAGVAVFRTAVRLGVARAVLGVALRDVVAQLRPALLAGVALVLLAGATALATADAWPPVQLAAVTLAGALGYGSVLWLVERQALVEAFTLLGVRPRLRRKSSKGVV